MTTNSTNAPDSSLVRSSGWTKGRIVFLSISAAVTLAVLLWAGKVLLPFILAVIIAYVLTPLVAGAERLRVPRAAAILLVYFVTFGTLYVSVAAISPRVYVEGMKLLRDTPALASQLSQQWSPRIDAWFQGVMERAGYVEAEPLPDTSAAIDVRPEPDGSFRIRMGTGVDVVQHGPGHWRIGPAIPRSSSRLNVSQLTSQGIDEFINYAKRNAMAVVRFGHTLVSEIARGVFLLFMTLMVAGYLMHTRENVLGFFRSLVPMRARIGFDRLVWRIDRGLAGVVRGQLLICAVNGVFSAIGFWMFDLKYWPILAIVAAVMSIVPIFGSILSSIPAVMIGLTQGFWTALWVLLWIIGIHQIEANLLNPKIIGVAAKIHPVLVVMALLIGEHFYGLWGALLAVPALSLAQSIFNHFRFESMPDVPPDSFLPPAGVGRLP